MLKKPKFRSKFEKAVADKLKKLKKPFAYETEKYEYVLPPKKYVIDFKVGDVYLEVKGYLDYEERLKMLAVKEAYPNLNICFVFMKPHQKLPRQKKTHAEWAVENGFKWVSLENLSDAFKLR